ncbi:MAG: phosphoribosylformylglycinamidine synthase [Deltaproteobacteria bacterium]|nr:phosphoribosylformylglycinamidine synthase [Deltaproteobacteria bacterium]
MAHRIEIGFQDKIGDVLGEGVKRRINEHLGISVVAVRVVDVYSIVGELSPHELEYLASSVFSDPVIHTYTIDAPLALRKDNFSWIIEVGFLPGVTDNVGKTASEALLTALKKSDDQLFRVFTSKQYLLQGNIGRSDVAHIASGLLANKLVEKYGIFSLEEYREKGGNKPYIPLVSENKAPLVEEISLEISDADLVALSRKRLLSLSLEEMKILQEHLRLPAVIERRAQFGLGKNITDAELECLAQTWSEHCKHKIFNAVIDYHDGKMRHEINSLFATFIKGATQRVREEKGERDFCLSVFVDNAGIISFDEEYNIVFKVETHNSPSALDPYGGALTGIVGVNRDPFGTGIGAKLIFNTDVFCFAPPDYQQTLPERILHPRRIFEGVREGVEHGGNKSGIPTINGCIVFDERFLGKPLVYCGTGGIMPKRINGKDTHGKEIYPGDVVVMVGGRIGKDGIHGATFSSEELHEGSPVSAVQIGDPITQKKMTDFLLVARDKELYRCITDNGAGGLSSSVGETARLAGGCDLDLLLAPLKYHGLNPWEILISESQERMTLAVEVSKLENFLSLAKKMDVEATAIGHYTDSGYFHIRYGKKTVVFIAMDFLHEGLPQMRLRALWQQPSHKEPPPASRDELASGLKRLLARQNICSKESTVRRYDHEVQGGSVIKPFTGENNDGPSDAAVIRPLLDSYAGVVVSNGICPRYSDIDTYHMAACALDEAIRNAVAVGASLEHLACLDNFCWCDPVVSERNPDGEYKLAQLVRANQALYDYTVAFGTPCISGKDSMKNDYQIGTKKISIPPTLLFSVIGKMVDVRLSVTMDFKKAGDIIYILGETHEELGGSEWYALRGYIGNKVPVVNATKAKKMYNALHGAISAGLVASAHDCSDGGLAVALAESVFAGGLGANIYLTAVPQLVALPEEALLFSESASRFVISVAPENKDRFEVALQGCSFGEVGVVTEEKMLQIYGLADKPLIMESTAELKRIWQATLTF